MYLICLKALLFMYPFHILIVQKNMSLTIIESDVHFSMFAMLKMQIDYFI